MVIPTLACQALRQDVLVDYIVVEHVMGRPPDRGSMICVRHTVGADLRKQTLFFHNLFLRLYEALTIYLYKIKKIINFASLFNEKCKNYS